MVRRDGISEINIVKLVLLENGLSKRDITILQCNTEYPTPYQDMNLKTMLTFKREENPNILENYYKFKDKGFEVYQVSLDRNRDEWAIGIKEDKLPWINVSDLKYYQSEAAILYNVYKIPSAFLLDPEGRIIAKDLELRGRNLYNKLNEVFNQK